MGKFKIIDARIVPIVGFKSELELIVESFHPTNNSKVFSVFKKNSIDELKYEFGFEAENQ